MLGKRFLFGSVLAALGLYACNQSEKSPVQVDSAGKGSARIALPALPAGFLVDSSQKALFSLEIVGPGSDTLRRSTYLLPGQPSHFLSVDGIPVGFNTFIGRLFRLDSVSGKAEQTHVGMDSAVIEAGRTAQIRLVLHQFTGSADVCIEVEGWASDSTCLPPPPVTNPIGGCYHLEVIKRGPTPIMDTLKVASLHIAQYDSMLVATLKWSSGLSKTTRGFLVGANGFSIGTYGPSEFQFSGHRSANGDTLIGLFNDSLLGIADTARAIMTSCLPETTIVEPGPDTACFNFTQLKANGKTDTGRVGIEGSGAWANVYTHWQGYATTYSYFSKLSGSLDSSALVEWHIHPPAGMFPDNLNVDSASYSLTIQGAYGIGKVGRLVPQPTKALGSLTAARVTCRESDFQF